MANNDFNQTVSSLFSGMDKFMTTKTVVGEPKTVGDTILVPLVDVSFGVAAGARLLLGRKVMTNLDSIFKSRDITLPTMVRLVYGFSSGHIRM